MCCMVVIRSYESSDREAVMRVQFETGLLGGCMSAVLDDEWLFTREVAYYLDEEPESVFVAVDEGEVVGYVLGCLDDSNHSSLRALLAQVKHILTRWFSLSRTDRVFWGGRLCWLVRAVIGPERKLATPPNAGHLHINVLPRARGEGVGSLLLERFFSYARSNGVSCLHADGFLTRLNPNASFWGRHGFSVFSQVRTSMWRRVFPGEEVFVVVYVKKL